MARGGKRTGAGRKPGKTGPTARTKAIRRQIAQHRELTAARTIEEIRRLGFSDIGALFEPNGRLKPLHDIPAAIRATIASVKVTKKNLVVGDGIQEDVVEVKLWDKLRALEMAAKHHGLLIEKVKLQVDGEVTLLEKINRARLRVAQARP